MTDRLAAALAELVDALREEVRTEARHADGPGRLLSIAEASALLGIGRSRLYAEISAGRLHTIEVGRRRLVPAASIPLFIASAAPDRGRP